MPYEEKHPAIYPLCRRAGRLCHPPVSSSVPAVSSSESAKYKGDAKIIGQTSGGGECTVASSYLPSGRSIQYSSNTILCNYDGTKEVRGVERGATPDIELPYYQFYDIDALEAAIAQ